MFNAARMITYYNELFGNNDSLFRGRNMVDNKTRKYQNSAENTECNIKRNMYLQCIKRNPRLINACGTGIPRNMCSNLYIEVVKKCKTKS